MKTSRILLTRALPALLFIAGPSSNLLAQAGEADQITEKDKQVFRDFVGQRKQKARLTQAIMNARMIGIALFEFETEYGQYPDETTAADVKENSGTGSIVKADSANDCFYQTIAGQIVEKIDIFTFENHRDQEKPKAPITKLDKCSFSYLSGLSTAGNPARPLVVAPLLKGKTTFDPQVLGGKAVVLRGDCSVQALPIEKDGRVLIGGMDIFDPNQPFWKGKVPKIKWPDN